MNEIKRMQQLAGIITEIKINNPNKPIVYVDEDKQPYIILKDDTKVYGYLNDDGEGFVMENEDDNFDDVIKYFGDLGELIDGGKYLLVYNKDVNLKD